MHMSNIRLSIRSLNVTDHVLGGMGGSSIQLIVSAI